ncbi:hypothetical protein QUA43_29370 [Microcoleus sp. N9_B4]
MTRERLIGLLPQVASYPCDRYQAERVGKSPLKWLATWLGVVSRTY